MNPFIPHFSNECLANIGQEEIKWPMVEKDLLIGSHVNIVVQINGKKRSLITTENSLEEKDLIDKIKKTNELQKFLEKKDIIKSIFIKDKLINLILK